MLKGRHAATFGQKKYGPEYFTKAFWNNGKHKLPWNLIASFRNPHPTPIEEYALGIRLLEHEMRLWGSGVRIELYNEDRDKGGIDVNRPSFRSCTL